MRTRIIFFSLVVSLLALSLAGCGLMGIPTAQPSNTPSGLVETQVAYLLTATANAAAPTTAQNATNTSIPAVTATGTAIILPSATSTQVPPTATATALPPTATPPPPTATVTPTSTPAPTATNTPNPRVKSEATYLSSAPDIDGVWDEWKTTQYPITSVVFVNSEATVDKDFKASYRVGWDSNYLYLAVKVHDKQYVQNASGANLYQGDSIELLLSTNPNADSPYLGLTAVDYQIGISPGMDNIGKNMEAYRWFPQNKAGKLTNITIGAVPMTEGYRIEAAIPWSVFSITPSRGQVLGFAVSVSTNDAKNHTVQQVMISSSPRRTLMDPTSWGQVTLK